MSVASSLRAVAKEDQVMPNARVFVGLCATCNNAKFCVYRKRRGSDAIYCEMFDPFVSSNGDGVATAPQVEATTTTSKPAEEAKGLCANCIHRNVCKLPRPSSGVWHCEEYA